MRQPEARRFGWKQTAHLHHAHFFTPGWVYVRPLLRRHVRACAPACACMCRACAGRLGRKSYCARRARACAGACALCFGVSIIRTCAHMPTHMHAHACTCGRCAIIADLSAAHARTCLGNLPVEDRAGPHMHAHALKRAAAHARTPRRTCTHMPSELPGIPRRASNAWWPSQSFLVHARASQSFPRP